MLRLSFIINLVQHTASKRLPTIAILTSQSFSSGNGPSDHTIFHLDFIPTSLNLLSVAILLTTSYRQFKIQMYFFDLFFFCFFRIAFINDDAIDEEVGTSSEFKDPDSDSDGFLLM